MTRLKVFYEAGGGVFERLVDVADDEEYWFEPSVGTNSLTVGKKGTAPWGCTVQPTLHTQHGGNAKLSDVPRPRLHIFNLVLVEVTS